MKAHLDVVGLIDVVAGAFLTALAVLVSLGVLLFAPWFNFLTAYQQFWQSPALLLVLSTALLGAAILSVNHSERLLVQKLT